MENFDGLVGSIATTVLKQGLRKETTIMLIVRAVLPDVAIGLTPFTKRVIFAYRKASEDIGNVAAGVLKVTYYPNLTFCFACYPHGAHHLSLEPRPILPQG